jgi:hypothetical protein
MCKCKQFAQITAVRKFTSIFTSYLPNKCQLIYQLILNLTIINLRQHGGGNQEHGEKHQQQQQATRIVDFFAGYRAVVRAKVAGLKAAQSEVPAVEREEAAQVGVSVCVRGVVCVCVFGGG